MFAEQIQEIIVDALSWNSGDWTFSSLARIRDGLAFEIKTRQLLIDYTRCLPVDTVLGRFRSLEEGFIRSEAPATDLSLHTDEAFILSRAEETELSAADLVSMAAMSESRALHAMYTLWTGGLLLRKNWRPAFDANHVAAMKGARLELKREAKLANIPQPVVEVPKEQPEMKVPEKETEITELRQRLEALEQIIRNQKTK